MWIILPLFVFGVAAFICGRVAVLPKGDAVVAVTKSSKPLAERRLITILIMVGVPLGLINAVVRCWPVSIAIFVALSAAAGYCWYRWNRPRQRQVPVGLSTATAHAAKGTEATTANTKAGLTTGAASAGWRGQKQVHKLVAWNGTRRPTNQAAPDKQGGTHHWREDELPTDHPHWLDAKTTRDEERIAQISKHRYPGQTFTPSDEGPPKT